VRLLCHTGFRRSGGTGEGGGEVHVLNGMDTEREGGECEERSAGNSIVQGQAIR